MRLNQVREINKTQLPRRINKLLKRNSQTDKRNFSRYLNGRRKKGAPSEKEKQQKRQSPAQQKLYRREVKKKNFPNGKGQFIDIRV